MTSVDIASALAPIASELVGLMSECDVDRIVITADVIDSEPYWDVCVREASGWVTSLHAFGGSDEEG